MIHVSTAVLMLLKKMVLYKNNQNNFQLSTIIN